MTNTFNYDEQGELITTADYCPATGGRCKAECPGLACRAAAEAFEEHIERGSE